jgi:hypothetical protein
MMTSRILISATTVAFLIGQMLGAAQASTVTYNLFLKDTSGPEGGSGILSVNGPIPGSGLDIFTPGGGGLTSLSFTIDGSNFTLGSALPGASATFLNGNLISLFYMGVLGGAKLTLDTVGLGYFYLDLNDLSHTSVGTISASATPLPSTWTMMLIGIAGFGFFIYRKKRPDPFTEVPA